MFASDCGRIRIFRHRREDFFAHTWFGVLHQFGADLACNIEKWHGLGLCARKAQLTRFLVCPASQSCRKRLVKNFPFIFVR